MSDDLTIHTTLTLPAAELSWSASRSSGPGGQNVNKVATRVDLRWDLAGSTAISDGQRERLRERLAGRLDAAGRVTIVSQTTRSQLDNLADARERLATLIRAALRPRKERRPTRPTRGSLERRLDGKKRRSDTKRQRQRPARDGD